MLATNNKRKIVILGTSFDTGNLGVSALAWSAISLIQKKWPESVINLVGNSSEYRQINISSNVSKISIGVWPIRFSPKILIKNHLLGIWIGICLAKLFPFMAEYCNQKNNTLRVILNADLIVDITAGDSFSDIYGIKRFVRLWLEKRIVQITETPFILLPQTYGPFKSMLARLLSRRVLNKAAMIYSRDKEGLAVVENLIGKSEKAKLSPDLAFILESKKPVSSCQPLVVSPQSPQSPQSPEARNLKPITKNYELVGLNVSGLLYSGGYTGKNEFGLMGDYCELMREIVEYFIVQENTKVLLVPHVVPQGWETENDLLACRKLRDSLPDAARGKTMIVESDKGQPFFDQCEIKYLIGQCDFFLGSRMHATIAAISQCVPTVGLAYSRKFAGVYETAGVEDCVVDMRSMTNDEVMGKIRTLYENKFTIKKRLETTIPEVKGKIYKIFEMF